MTALARDDVRDKRQAILNAARDLFARQGYEETTIAQIARVAGMAVGTVYLYFQNKHDILVDVCLTLKAEVAQVIQSPEILALPLQQVPRAVIEASFRTSRKNLRFMNSFQVEGQSPAEVARLQGAQDEVSGSLNAYFQGLIAQGQLPPFDTAAYAELLNQLVSATLHQCFAVEQGVREEFYREAIIELVERLFFGPPLTAGGSDGSIA
jgi:TetR/AcrR family fatty acid metabolism transcriptional regulator